jgi:hypothetical protein
LILRYPSVRNNGSEIQRGLTERMQGMAQDEVTPASSDLAGLTFVALLRGLPGLEGLPEQAVEGLSFLLKAPAQPAGAVIVHEDVIDDRFYIVAAGDVELSRQRIDGPTALLRRAVRQWFGENALRGSQRRQNGP